MKRAVSMALAVQIALSLLWILPASMADSSAGLGLFALLFYYVIASALPALFALWLLWRHPPERRKAAVILLLPLLSVFVPTLLQGFIGGPVESGHLIALLITLAIAAAIAAIAVPRKLAAMLPPLLFRSRALNGLIAVGLVLAWIVIVAGVLWGLSDAMGNGYRRDTGTGIAYALILVMMYVLAVAAASLLVAVWASLGLRSGLQSVCRRLFFTQLFVAAPGVVAGIAVALFWLAQK